MLEFLAVETVATLTDIVIDPTKRSVPEAWGISQFLHQRHVLYDLDQRMMRKRCSFDDCTNIIVKKEDFARHGANVKG